MKRKLSAICAVMIILSMIFSGCTTIVIEMTPEMLEQLEAENNEAEKEQEEPAFSQEPNETQQSEPQESEDPGEESIAEQEPAEEAISMQPITDIPIGSATYLGGESVLVTIYLDDNRRDTYEWTQDEVEVANRHFKIAVDYMIEEGERYGQDVVIHYEDESLRYFADIDANIEGNDEYAANDEITSWIEQNVDTQAIMDEYQTNSIGYVFLVNGAGISFCYPYEEGDGQEWFDEKCYIYLYDLYGEGIYDNPATYAHEIMHMFGAVDLYDEFTSDGVTMDVVEYIEEEHPMEIMYTTYTQSEGYSYDSIPNYISDITAYCIGWIDDCDEIDMFPTLERENAACFETKEVSGGGGWGPRH